MAVIILPTAATFQIFFVFVYVCVYNFYQYGGLQHMTNRFLLLFLLLRSYYHKLHIVQYHNIQILLSVISNTVSRMSNACFDTTKQFFVCIVFFYSSIYLLFSISKSSSSIESAKNSMC